MKKVKIFVIQILFSIILVLGVLIGSKSSATFKELIKKNVYENNISFGYLNTLYTKYIGSIIPFKLNIGTTPVFNETLSYKSKNMYLDGASLEVENNYLVPSIQAGLVVFAGDKEGYGSTIIVEGEDGVEVWYGNLSNVSVKLYDYIDAHTYIGTTVDNKLYLVFKKDGNTLNYEDYLK